MQSKRDYGFTLIELLCTVAVAAVLATLAAPSFQHTINHTRLASARNQMAGALKLARSMAVTGQAASIACPSQDGRHCAPGQHWEVGWLVAMDADHDGQPDTAPERVFAGPASPVRLHTSAGRQQVRFHPDGSAAGSNLTMTICLAGKPDSADSLVLSNSGRLRPGKPSPAQAQACSRS